MKTPSILARSALEGRLVTNQPHCKCKGHLSLKITRQRWRVFFFFFLGKKGELLLVFTDSISGDSSAQLY